MENNPFDKLDKTLNTDPSAALEKNLREVKETTIVPVDDDKQTALHNQQLENDFQDWTLDNIVNKPLAWFVINMMSWGVLGWVIMTLMRRLGTAGLQVVSVRMKVGVATLSECESM